MKVNNPFITSEHIISYIKNKGLWNGKIRRQYIDILKGYGYAGSNLSFYRFIETLNPLQLNELYNKLKQL